MSKMFYKMVLRATNLPKRVSITQNYMDYILDEGAHFQGTASKNKDVWYNKFIGFFADKSGPGYGFGYYSTTGEEVIYYPIFVDKVDYQLEFEENWEEKPYLVMFYGADNHSQFIRFKTKEEVITFINSEFKSISDIEDKYQMHFYNS